MGDGQSRRLSPDVHPAARRRLSRTGAAMHRARETMAAGWRRVQGQGLFSGNVEDAAHMCWTATHGVLVLELSGMLRPPVQARTIAMRAVAAIAKGLNAPVQHTAQG